MFARDVQYIVDEYLDGLISESHFQLSSSPWSNYETDYKPVVEFARENGLDVVAANAPRRYANRVTREGRSALNDLSDQALSYMAPLPYGAASDTYTEQWNKVMQEAMAEMKEAMKPEEEAPPKTLCSSEEGGCAMGDGDGQEMDESHEMRHDEDASHEDDEDDHAASHESDEDAAPAMPTSGQHGGGSMLDAQSLWDATMAWSIAEYMTRHPGAKVTHMVGGFHVESGTGIPEHLIQYRPDTKMLIISNQSVDDINTFVPEEHTGLGDFIVLGDASLPRTYETRER